jgi:hypothetical protein
MDKFHSTYMFTTTTTSELQIILTMSLLYPKQMISTQACSTTHTTSSPHHQKTWITHF